MFIKWRRKNNSLNKQQPLEGFILFSFEFNILVMLQEGPKPYLKKIYNTRKLITTITE